MTNKITKTVLKAQLKAIEFMKNGRTVLKNKKGFTHTTEVLLMALGACAVVGLISLLAILLIKNDVFPGLTDKVHEILNMK